MTELRQQIQNRASKIFREVFEDPSLAISEKTVAADIPNWDSLTHINLILALEQEFNVAFTSKEVDTLSRVGDLLDLLEVKWMASEAIRK